MASFLVVGAGFAGSVFARTLADAGHSVTIIDKRDHLAGNAFDYVNEHGVRVHKYGPHLFHTNNAAVVDWVTRFGNWIPYEHRVRALLPDGRNVPLPINRETVNTVFNTNLATADEVESFLKSVAEPIETPANAAEHLRSQIGSALTDLFFRPYTKKMWDMDLEDLSASVVKRIPLRFDDDDRYFPNDRFQLLPEKGYTAVFESILDHPNITITLNTAYYKGMEHGYRHCFNSMPIDEFFDFEFGELPYRSIKFHSHDSTRDTTPVWSVTNYTDTGPFTRETHWHALPAHDVLPSAIVTRTVEEPCDYRDNGLERYYPVKTADDRFSTLYQSYRDLAKRRSNISFIGRCGTYQYLDMHQVINQSLAEAQRYMQTLP